MNYIGQTFLIGNVYRNHCNSKEDFINSIQYTFSDIDKFDFDDILITGDFNLPLIKWDQPCNISPEDRFIELLSDYYFTQMILKPTRHRLNQSSNILDLVITNDDNWVSNIEFLPPLGKSDHNVLLLTLSVAPTENITKNKFHYNYFKGN